MKGVCFFMDYELMMNGNVKIGQIAPEFEAQTKYKSLYGYVLAKEHAKLKS